MLRIAIIFDDRARPETTGVYYRRALGSLADVVFFHPDDLAQMPRSGFDFYLVIDDGFDYPLPAGAHPLVYLAIDTHIGFERPAACGRPTPNGELIRRRPISPVAQQLTADPR